MGKARTSLTLSQNAIESAKSRIQELGYDSVSEYIEALILQDEHEKRGHVIVRGPGGITYRTEEPKPKGNEEEHKPDKEE